MLFATRYGQVIKIPQTEFSNPRSVGSNAIRLRENDQLVDVIETDGSREIVLSTRFGYSLRFHEETVRTVMRKASGVRGMKLRGEDTIVALTLVEKDHLLTISDVGFGKRTEFDDFRGHGRGTMGVRNMQLERNAIVIESRAVLDTDEIIVMTASGVVIRMPVSEIRVIGRGTKGVRTIRLDDKDRVVGIAIVQPEIETIENGINGQEPENNEPVS
jgi:DNA gyrase subunit A